MNDGEWREDTMNFLFSPSADLLHSSHRYVCKLFNLTSRKKYVVDRLPYWRKGRGSFLTEN